MKGYAAEWPALPCRQQYVAEDENKLVRLLQPTMHACSLAHDVHNAFERTLGCSCSRCVEAVRQSACSSQSQESVFCDVQFAVPDKLDDRTAAQFLVRNAA